MRLKTIVETGPLQSFAASCNQILLTSLSFHKSAFNFAEDLNKQPV